MIYKAYKKLGETPLQCLQRVVLENDIPPAEKITFAGRLDPAAEGEMLFLSGEDVKDKESYMHMDKIYEVVYLLGICTDTGDLLGLITNHTNESVSCNTDVLQKLIGTRMQKFHAFSSKVVDGKPLWQHAKEGSRAAAEHEITIHSIELLDEGHIACMDIVKRVHTVTNLVVGDFRQPEIRTSWNVYAEEERTIPCIHVRVHASSGSYMRVLGEELGALLNVPVCAYSIIRTQIML